MKKLSLSLLFVFICFSSFGQDTLKLGDNKSPKATLADIAWLSGHWRGEAFGGIIEEIWSPPLGDSMMGSFKLVSEGKTAFYEICQLVEENGSLSFRLKHFNGDLTGWEEKNEREEFPLVKVEKDAVYFNDFTIKRISENEIHMYVVISDEGEPEEVEFKYFRFKMK